MTTGRGQINAMMINNGLVDANVSGSTLVLQTNAKTNNGMMGASNNATLSIFVDVDGSGGWTADDGTIVLQSGTQVTTTGPVAIGEDDFVQMLASNNELTGFDLTIADTGRFSANGSVALSGRLDLRSTDEADFTSPPAIDGRPCQGFGDANMQHSCGSGVKTRICLHAQP